MMYMKKYFPVVLIIILGLFIAVLPGQASDEATWNLKWNNDGSLDETVTVFDHNIVIEADNWETSRSDQALTLSRHVDNWQDYLNLEDGLPLVLVEKNYGLVKTSTLTMKDASPGSLYEQFGAIDGARLSIEVPGIISETSAQEKIESTAVWELGSAGAITLKASIFDGVVLGIIFFALCAIIIFFVFLRRIKRVNQLIAEEYSLEKAAEEFARGDTDKEEP
jgi:hypothetical protein